MNSPNAAYGAVRPLRFLHLTTFYPPYSFGGDGVYLHRLAGALADEGHEVDVVHCLDAYGALHPRPPEIAFPDHPGVSRHGLRSRARWLSPLLTQLTGRPVLKRRRLNAIVRSKRYDVIHFHNISLLGLTALDCGLCSRKPSSSTRARVLARLPDPHAVEAREARLRAARVFPLPARGAPAAAALAAPRRIAASASAVDLFFAPSRFAVDMHDARGFPRPMMELPYFVEPADEDWQTLPRGRTSALTSSSSVGSNRRRAPHAHRCLDANATTPTS